MGRAHDQIIRLGWYMNEALRYKKNLKDADGLRTAARSEAKELMTELRDEFRELHEFPVLHGAEKGLDPDELITTIEGLLSEAKIRAWDEQAKAK